MKSIGDASFGYCSNLTAINVSQGNTVYSSEEGILYDKNKTTLCACPGGKSGHFTVPSSVANIAMAAFSGCVGLAEITIPSSVANIGKNVFEGCSGLTEVSLPSSVTSMGTNVFNMCYNLTALEVSPENPVYCFEGGIMYNKDKTTLCFCLQGRTEPVTIPSSVTRFEDFAFYRCSRLTDITIPSSVTSIGEYAFQLCSNLSTIYSLNPVPPATLPNCFSRIPGNATLYVPQNAVEAYRNAEGWNEVPNIQGFDPTGINGMEADGSNGKEACYDLTGRRLNAPKKGVNIINGKKVVMR